MNKSICDQWKKNPNVNPRTGRQITETGKVYKDLLKECGPPKPIRKPSPPKPIKKPSPPMMILEEKEERTPSPSKLPRILYSEEELLEEKMKDPEWIPFWKTEEYWDIAKSSIDFLINKYKNKVNICRSGVGIIISLTEEFNIETEFVIDTDNFSRCLNETDKGLSIFEIAIGGLINHTSILIINHIYKTIEYYDPQSNEYEEENELVRDISEKIQENLFTLIKKSIKRKDYKFIDMYITCPLINFQNFESSGFIPKNLKHEGFCILWSSFFCHLRILYYKKTPDEFFEIIENIYRNMREELRTKTKKKELNPFAKFIYEYALYFQKKLT